MQRPTGYTGSETGYGTSLIKALKGGFYGRRTSNLRYYTVDYPMETKWEDTSTIHDENYPQSL